MLQFFLQKHTYLKILSILYTVIITKSISNKFPIQDCANSENHAINVIFALIIYWSVINDFNNYYSTFHCFLDFRAQVEEFPLIRPFSINRSLFNDIKMMVYITRSRAVLLLFIEKFQIPNVFLETN